MSYTSGNGASGPFMSAARLLANVAAGAAVWFAAPLLYAETIAPARAHAVQHFPGLIAGYAGWLWAAGCVALVFALAKATVSTLIVQGAYALAHRLKSVSLTARGL